MFSFGFYNSKDGDRKYNATHFGKIFDGIIQDGIFGAAPSPLDGMFNVVPNDAVGATQPSVVINPGKAWLSHTWNILDAKATVTLNTVQANQKRTDIIVIEVNDDYTELTGSNPRTNSIKVVEGSNVSISSGESLPALTQIWDTNNTKRRIWQYPLAYVTVYGSDYDTGSIQYTANTVKAANIQNRVNVTGALDSEKYVTWIPLVTGSMMNTDLNTYLPDWQGLFDQMILEDTAKFNNWFDELHDLEVEDPTAQAAITQLNIKIDQKILYGTSLPPLTLDPGQVYFQIDD